MKKIIKKMYVSRILPIIKLLAGFILSIILTVIIDDDIYRFYFLTIAFFSFALVFVFNLFWKWYDSGKFINMFSIENIKKEICL